MNNIDLNFNNLPNRNISKRPLSSLLTKEYELKDEIDKLKSEINELKTDNIDSINRVNKYEISMSNFDENFADLAKRKVNKEKELFFNDENQKNSLNKPYADRRSQFLSSMETFINNEENIVKEKPFNDITHHIRLTNFPKSEENRRHHSANQANLKRSLSLHTQASTLLIKLFY
jgi:hypothetical protein